MSGPRAREGEELRPAVLIVDDDGDLRDAWTRILRAAGYRASAAPTGESGVAAALAEAPDIILLDRALPDRDGTEVCISLRRELLAASPLIAVVSGFRLDSEDRIRALDSGADEVFAKPIGSRELLSRVRALDRLWEERRRLKEESSNWEALLKAAHNRIANDLAAVENLLRMRAEAAPEGAADSGPLLEDLAARVRAITELHFRLRTGTMGNCVEAADYLAGILGSIERYACPADQAVRLTWTVDRSLLLGDTNAATLGMLVTELVGNALRHAFPGGRGGCVELSLRADGGGALLRVRDDGVGLPADFALERTSDLGLRLVEALASRLGGRLARGDGPGTSWEVRLADACLERTTAAEDGRGE